MVQKYASLMIRDQAYRSASSDSQISFAPLQTSEFLHWIIEIHVEYISNRLRTISVAAQDVVYDLPRNPFHNSGIIQDRDPEALAGLASQCEQE